MVKMKFRKDRTDFEVEDVELPAVWFRKTNTPNSHYDAQYWYRLEVVEGRIRSVGLQKYEGWDRGEYSWSISVQSDTTYSSMDSAAYVLGRGEYACTEAEWGAALQEFQEFLRTA